MCTCVLSLLSVRGCLYTRFVHLGCIVCSNFTLCQFQTHWNLYLPWACNCWYWLRRSRCTWDEVVKSQDLCMESNIEFFPTGLGIYLGATSTVHFMLESWTNQEADRCGLPHSKIQVGLYQWISLTLQWEYMRMIMRRVSTQDSSWSM